MKLRIFTILDKATEAYHQPFFLLTVSEAKRAFSTMAKDPDSKINQHPTDFVLFHIGEYDNSNATISTEQGHINLGSAYEYQTHEYNNLTDAPEITGRPDLKGVK